MKFIKFLVWVITFVSMYMIRIIFFTSPFDANSLHMTRDLFKETVIDIVFIIVAIVVSLILSRICEKTIVKVLRRKIETAAESAGVSPYEYIKKDVPVSLIECLQSSVGDKSYIKMQLHSFRKQSQVSIAQASILYDEFSKN